ncbi:MAG: hypothetical protein GX116_01840 [Fibrobacter sp.]|jgi:hypothetical protein|nr:hypothetical protein [Fibrobacter sp.]
MKKWWVLFCVLSGGHLYGANFLFSSSSYPGFFGDMGATLETGMGSAAASPAKNIQALEMSVYSGDLNGLEGVQEFGGSFSYGKTSYHFTNYLSIMQMDSIYRDLLVGLDFSYTHKKWTIGLGFIWNQERVKGYDSWYSYFTKLGFVSDLTHGFSIGSFYIIEENHWQTGLHWTSETNTIFFMEWTKKKMNIGQSITFGAFCFQMGLAFPGPEVSIGLLFQWDSFLIGTGAYRSSNAFSAKNLHLIWRTSSIFLD